MTAYGRIDKVPDATLAVCSPSTHTVVRVIRGAADGGGQEITPALAHTTTLAPAKAARVSRPASQTRAHTVGKLVDNDASLQVTVPVRGCGVPDVHPAATVLAIWWGHKVGIVESATILRVCDDCVVLLTASAKVVLLEVTGHLIKPVTRGVVSWLLSSKKEKDVPVVEIVDHVGGIEHLGDAGVDVLPSLLQGVLAGGELGIVDVVEVEILSTVWSVVRDEGVTTIPVFMSENVVAPGNGGVTNGRTRRETVVVRIWVVGDGQGVPAQGTGKFVVVLGFGGATAFAWVVDTPLENVVSCEAPVLPGNGSVGIGSPVDDGDDLVRRVGRDGGLVPIVFHLNFELPNEIEVGGSTVRNLDIGQTSLDGVDGFGDVVD